MKYLITGGCGFLGSNIAAHLLQQKHEVAVIDNFFRVGAEKNLQRLYALSVGNFNFHKADVRNAYELEPIIEQYHPDVIFHFAGQVAMTTSIKNPYLDFEINAKGTLNILECVRKYCPTAIVCYSSSNKVYGDFSDITFYEDSSRYYAKGYEAGFDESIALSFHSPYGCSKGCADQYMLDYARIYDLNTIVLRHSSIFGTYQYGTIDQGWVAWFCQKALETKQNPNTTFTICGNGKQVRDVLFVSDLIDCYQAAIQNIHQTKGQAFNIGGGVSNSLSLLELFNLLNKHLNITLNPQCQPWRQSDQKVFIANTQKAAQLFSWQPKTDKLTGIIKMLEWMTAIEGSSIASIS